MIMGESWCVCVCVCVEFAYSVHVYTIIKYSVIKGILHTLSERRTAGNTNCFFADDPPRYYNQIIYY